MNRTMDGDTVIVELQPVCNWLELGESAKKNAVVNEYTNETAIEKRVGIDYKVAKEEEIKRPPKQRENSNGTQKVRTKKNTRTRYDEPDGYIASNSDNNLELTHPKIKRERNVSSFSNA